jgi:hypothetical protein
MGAVSRILEYLKTNEDASIVKRQNEAPKPPKGLMCQANKCVHSGRIAQHQRSLNESLHTKHPRLTSRGYVVSQSFFKFLYHTNFFE